MDIKERIPAETIKKAVAGDKDAISYIIKAYEPVMLEELKNQMREMGQEDLLKDKSVMDKMMKHMRDELAKEIRKFKIDEDE